MSAKKCVATLGILASLTIAHPALAQPASNDAASTAAAAAPRGQAAPNILVWMLDDVGFAQLAAYGGLIATPNIDRMAAKGVRFSNYHTTPICSATRAAFLTGRNSHTVHMGGHPVFPSDAPGYDTRIPASAGTIAENLRQHGYATFALGKWDHLPLAEISPSGPQNYWPLQQGFDRFYGFLFSETNNYAPDLWRDNTPVNLPNDPSYHLNDDLADQAIQMIGTRDALARPRPFFMYLATGTAHAPHHAPQRWIARYRGKFDQGWDQARAQILKRQIALGAVAPNTPLAARPAGMAAWSSLAAEEKRLYARQMEVFAAALSHADEQFGRILDELDRRGELSNTVVVITSDNGASAEGGHSGTYNELLFATGQLPNARENLAYFDRWGGPETFPHYAFGWAVAGNTPFRQYKQTTYEGGTRVPLIIADLRHASNGSWRDGFAHVTDITPTLLDIAEVAPAARVNNTAQSQFDGVSFAARLSQAANAKSRSDQYFEVFGHRAYWSNDWKIVAPSRLDVWDITAPARLNSPWQLYDLKKDPTESEDLAARMPGKTAELAAGFAQAAERFHVNPITGQADSMAVLARRTAQDFAARKGRWNYAGPVSRIPKPFAPPIDSRSFTATADLELETPTSSAPVFVLGGRFGGIGLYLSQGIPTFMVRSLKGQAVTVRAHETLGQGRQMLTLSVDRQIGEGKSRVSLRSGERLLVSEDILLEVPAVVPETFDVGRDDATALSAEYRANADFPGKLYGLQFQFYQEK